MPLSFSPERYGPDAPISEVGSRPATGLFLHIAVEYALTKGRTTKRARSTDDTGLDMPEIVNLFFLTIFCSTMKFWQMLKGGARVCPKLFGLEWGKEEFWIIEFRYNLEVFHENLKTVDGADACRNEGRAPMQ